MSMRKIAVIISKVLTCFAVSVACLWVGVAQPAMAQQKVASGESDSRQIERGRYVVKISGCNNCHTAGYAMTVIRRLVIETDRCSDESAT